MTIKTDKLRVVSKDLLYLLPVDNPVHQQYIKKSQPKKEVSSQGDDSRPLTPNQGITDEERKLAQRNARQLELQEESAQLQQKLQRIREDKKQREEEKMMKMYNDVFKYINYDQGITANIQDIIEDNKKQALKSKVELYEEWKQKVFKPLQHKIAEKVDERSIKDIRERLYNQFQAYLNACNTKAAIFRDVIIEEDYDPLVPQTQTARINTIDICDPLKRDMEKTKSAQRAMHGNSWNQASPHLRAMLNTQLWNKVEATPYGRGVDKEGNYVINQPLEQNSKLRKANFKFCDYEIPTGREVVDQEFPVGKCVPPGHSSGRSMFATLQHQDATKSYSDMKAQDLLKGDRWLEAKGKRVVTTDCTAASQGANIVDLVHHTAHRQPEFTGGDRWLEAKGKRRVEGPSPRDKNNSLMEL